MTTRGSCMVVTLIGSLLAAAASGHAESAWKLWQQETVFTERWWVPTGWSFHWKATEMTPVGLTEFQTHAECQLAEIDAMRPDAHRAREMEAKGKSGMTSTRSVSRFACVPRAWRPEDRAWRRVEMNAKRLVVLLVSLGMLALATSASAEGAWFCGETTVSRRPHLGTLSPGIRRRENARKRWVISRLAYARPGAALSSWASRVVIWRDEVSLFPRRH